jgi:hypothetical protein
MRRELILPKKRGEKMFKIHQLLNAHAHTVLRLPPYNCNLSPIELAWTKVDEYWERDGIVTDVINKFIINVQDDSSDDESSSDSSSSMESDLELVQPL